MADWQEGFCGCFDDCETCTIADVAGSPTSARLPAADRRRRRHGAARYSRRAQAPVDYTGET
jgi:hypothetical protein